MDASAVAEQSVVSLGRDRSKHGRSRLTNHKDLLPNLKGGSSAARRFRDLVNGFIADQGGADNCSEIKLGLLRRLAAITVQGELVEAQMINGEQVDITQLCQLASTTVRLSQRLGLERKTKNITPTLSDYINTAPASGEEDNG